MNSSWVLAFLVSQPLSAKFVAIVAVVVATVAVVVAAAVVAVVVQ